MIEIILDRIEKQIRQDFENEQTGHDLQHLKKVLNYSRMIQEKEGGVKDVVLIAALVHDIHRILKPTVEHPTHVGVPPVDSLKTVEEILKRCEVQSETITEVLKVVELHDDKNNKELNLETQIVQDSDMLAALGKEGLRRTIKYCKHKNIPIYNSSYLLTCDEYIPNLNPISTTHYVFRTMIPHIDNMHTKTAKKIAKPLIKVLEDFVQKNLSDDRNK